ncbi:hypothetical protein BpHYR1_047200 [Brachionus plicatilis]|uniref:Uncharacterized protein n=1 Tax=Brachionus plicatilis TaxID=10195 RepID=A0A3M7PGU8_BRAPC|nr:hypothetical protein BpHYR1_047200 [Brachionus plicatilis]
MSKILNLNVKNFIVSSLSLLKLLQIEVRDQALFYQDDIETNINDVVQDAQKRNHEAVEHATIKIQSQDQPKKK